MSNEPEIVDQAEQESEHKALRAVGWFGVGMAIATLGIYIGFEIRGRYKFKRRTPYDFYANAEAQSTSEFGVGI